jgi:predicted nucleic acid-binding protein
VNEVVLDASVVLEWFVRDAKRRTAAARKLRSEFEAGELVVHSPRLLHLEILNVAGRRWAWDPEALVELARALDDLPFELWEPDLTDVAEWVGRGLTAYDAEYVALAARLGVPLMTNDQGVLTAAPEVARSPG